MRFFKTVKNQLSLIKSNAFGFQVRYDISHCAPTNTLKGLNFNNPGCSAAEPGVCK